MLVVDTSTNNIEQFVSNSLLTALIELKIELAKYLISIICSGLHGHHSGGMLACDAVEQGCIEHQVKILGNELREDCIHVRLNKKVIVERTYVFLLLVLLCGSILLKILLCLL